jgi:hypothetical protein
MPVLFDVVQTPGAFGFAVNHPAAGCNIGEGWPQAVLPFVTETRLLLSGWCSSVPPDHQVESSKP